MLMERSVLTLGSQVPFAYSAIYTTIGVEFHHPTRNASRIRWKAENRVLTLGCQVPFAYSDMCETQREAKNIRILQACVKMLSIYVIFFPKGIGICANVYKGQNC